MSFDVLVTERAEQELNQAADWIARDAPDTAEKWFKQFVEAIISLGKNPERCGYARENDRFSFDLRQLLYGRRRSYRALFTVRQNVVVVLSVRHSAQRDLSPEDLEG